MLLPQKVDAIYEIPCGDCQKSNIGETGRLLGTHVKEHQKELEKFEAKPYTRQTRKTSVTEPHKSAITDHVSATNHSINWDESRVIDRESNRLTCWIKESIWIKRRGKHTMNKDKGAYRLNNIYSTLIMPSTPVSDRDKGQQHQ